MKQVLVPNKVYYSIIDRTYTASTHIYATDKDDDPSLQSEIKKNKQAAAAIYQSLGIITLKQVHGARVIQVSDKAINALEEPKADGVITSQPQLVLAIKTADCVPVLLACSRGTTIGAIHCGWRSVRAGIIAHSIKCMRSAGADDILAVIGPSILQKSYEVDAAFFADFSADNANNEAFFIPAPIKNKYMFDLPGYVKSKLQQERVRIVHHIEEDTYDNPAKYPSRRRSFHNDKQYTQHILSTIMMSANTCLQT